MIRPETSADIATIAAITQCAFAYVEHSSQTEHHIVDALRDAGALSLSLVAELNSKVVGHVALSPVSISDGSLHWYGLGPISVDPKYQNHHIGSQLMYAAIEALKAQKASGCVLLGDPNYYSRFGFKPAPDLVYPGVPIEYFQALAFDTTLPTGVVTYHRAFAVEN